jgi:hypothetical protein
MHDFHWFFAAGFNDRAANGRTILTGYAKDASLNNRAHIDRIWLISQKINEINAGAKNVNGTPPADLTSITRNRHC